MHGRWHLSTLTAAARYHAADCAVHGYHKQQAMARYHEQLLLHAGCWHHEHADWRCVAEHTDCCMAATYAH